jgi:hypothetical protein
LYANEPAIVQPDGMKNKISANILTACHRPDGRISIKLSLPGVSRASNKSKGAFTLFPTLGED